MKNIFQYLFQYGANKWGIMKYKIFFFFFSLGIYEEMIIELRAAWSEGVIIFQGKTKTSVNTWTSVSTWASLIAQLVKSPPAVQAPPAWFLGLADLLEKG